MPAPGRQRKGGMATEPRGPFSGARSVTADHRGEWSRDHVEVIGELPHYTTITSFVVTPVVGLVRPGFRLALDPFEVAEAMFTPCAKRSAL